MADKLIRAGSVMQICDEIVSAGDARRRSVAYEIMLRVHEMPAERIESAKWMCVRADALLGRVGICGGCGNSHFGVDRIKYCPDCGARMEF